MAGNVEDHVRYILRKRGYNDTCVRMADGYWLYGKVKYYSPVYKSGNVFSPAYVATRLISEINKGKSVYIEDILVAKMETLEPEDINIPGAEYTTPKVKEMYTRDKDKPVRTKIVQSSPLILVAIFIGLLGYLLFGRR